MKKAKKETVVRDEPLLEKSRSKSMPAKTDSRTSPKKPETKELEPEHTDSAEIADELMSTVTVGPISEVSTVENEVALGNTAADQENNEGFDKEDAYVSEDFISGKEVQNNIPPAKFCTSGKQKKASFDEYRKLFLETPRITDRKTVFISGDLRDRLDEISRKLGDRKMSVSGFIENLARHHLDIYEDDLNAWKKL